MLDCDSSLRLTYECVTCAAGRDAFTFMLLEEAAEGPKSTSLSVSVYTESKEATGTYDIAVYAEELVYGLKTAVETLKVTIEDPCAKQALKLVYFNENPLVYELAGEARKVTIKVSKLLPECPAEAQLHLTCDKQDCATSDTYFTLEEVEDDDDSH